MTTTLLLDVLVGTGLGVVAGVVFFGGLRWTVDRLATSRRPMVLATTSMLVRTLALAGLLVLGADGRLVRIVVALVAILAVRGVMVARARSDVEAMDQQDRQNGQDREGPESREGQAREEGARWT